MDENQKKKKYIMPINVETRVGQKNQKGDDVACGTARD